MQLKWLLVHCIWSQWDCTGDSLGSHGTLGAPLKIDAMRAARATTSLWTSRMTFLSTCSSSNQLPQWRYWARALVVTTPNRRQQEHCSNEMKWMGFKATFVHIYGLNWTRVEVQAEHATSRSRRFHTLLNQYEWAEKKLFFSKLEGQSRVRTRDFRLS